MINVIKTDKPPTCLKELAEGKPPKCRGPRRCDHGVDCMELSHRDLAEYQSRLKAQDSRLKTYKII